VRQVVPVLRNGDVGTYRYLVQVLQSLDRLRHPGSAKQILDALKRVTIAALAELVAQARDAEDTVTESVLTRVQKHLQHNGTDTRAICAELRSSTAISPYLQDFFRSLLVGNTYLAQIHTRHHPLLPFLDARGFMDSYWAFHRAGEVRTRGDAEVLLGHYYRAPAPRVPLLPVDRCTPGELYGLWWTSGGGLPPVGAGVTRLVIVSFEQTFRLPQLPEQVRELHLVLPWCTDLREGPNLEYNASLRQVRYTDLASLRTVGPGWMSEWTALESVSFGHLPVLEYVGSNWLDECPRLRSVTGRLPVLRRVCAFWLNQCPALVEFSVRTEQLRSVDALWLASCTALTAVSFDGLQALEEVSGSWLSGCTRLQSAAGTLPALRRVGGYWLSGCTALKNFSVDAPELRSVGPSWRSGCAALVELTVNAPLLDTRVFMESHWAFHRAGGVRTRGDAEVLLGRYYRAPTRVPLLPVDRCTPGELYGLWWTSGGGLPPVGTGVTRLVIVSFEQAFRLPELPEQVRELHLVLPWCTHLQGSQNPGSNTTLRQVQYTDLTSLRAVGLGWMCAWTALESVTFGHLPVLASIGHDCLAECRQLQSVTGTLPALGQVGGSWLRGCTALMDFSVVAAKLRSVGPYWLAGCTALTSVTFDRMPRLDRVERRWLSACTQLRSVTIDLPALERVAEKWLFQCTSLVDVSVDAPGLVLVGPCWLAECTALETVVFDRMPKLAQVRDRWLYGCSRLQSVTGELPALGRVGGSWLSACTQLRSVTIDLPALFRVEEDWLFRCTALVEFSVIAPELGSVGLRWLAECTALETVAFDRMPKLVRVRDMWLSGCTGLRSVTIDLPALERVGGYWLSGCTALRHFSVVAEKLRVVGPHWLSGCTARAKLSVKIN
jgi:hypothetical protein